MTPERQKEIEDLINSVEINKGNLEYIAQRGKVNGSLRLELRRILSDQATKCEGEIEAKDQEIQRLGVELKVCEELSAIRSTLITNLNNINEAQYAQLTALKAVSAKMAGLLKEYVDMGKVSRTSLLYQEATEALVAYHQLNKEKV